MSLRSKFDEGGAEPMTESPSCRGASCGVHSGATSLAEHLGGCARNAGSLPPSPLSCEQRAALSSPEESGSDVGAQSIGGHLSSLRI